MLREEMLCGTMRCGRCYDKAMRKDGPDAGWIRAQTLPALPGSRRGIRRNSGPVSGPPAQSQPVGPDQALGAFLEELLGRNRRAGALEDEFRKVCRVHGVCEVWSWMVG
jgi:hypothetical protein